MSDVPTSAPTSTGIIDPDQPLTREQASALLGSMALAIIKVGTLVATTQLGDKAETDRAYDDVKAELDKMVSNLISSGILPKGQSSDGQ